MASEVTEMQTKFIEIHRVGATALKIADERKALLALTTG